MRKTDSYGNTLQAQGTLLNTWWCPQWKGNQSLCICMTDLFCYTVKANTTFKAIVP